MGSKKRAQKQKRGGQRRSRKMRGGDDPIQVSTMEFKETDKLILLIIDPQNDFHPEDTKLGTTGSLAVVGANEDSVRIASLIKSGVNGSPFDEIIVTLDTHNVNHIAHPSFWTSEDGTEPPTMLPLDEKYTPKDTSLTEWCKYYKETLTQNAGVPLIIWNPHCIHGTSGHAVVKVIADELIQWSKKTGKTVDYRQKGQNNLTEMYSVIKAEVPITSDTGILINGKQVPEDKATQLNKDLLDALLDPEYSYNSRPTTSNSIRQGSEFNFTKTPPIQFSSTKVFICGQALTHCVKGSTEDIIEYIEDPILSSIGSTDQSKYLKSMYLLADCCSPIVLDKQTREGQFKKVLDGFSNKINIAYVDISPNELTTAK